MRHVAAIVSIVVLFSTFVGCNSSSTQEKGSIHGSSLVPKNLDVTKAEKEAKYYTYLQDASKQRGESAFPPVLKVISYDLNSLKGKNVTFEFKDLDPGEYLVSVHIDSGRPYVRPGSKAFTAYPGDYTTMNEEPVTVNGGQVTEVSITSGAYISVPEGYTSPVHLDE
jgi:hypothetical protein